MPSFTLLDVETGVAKSGFTLRPADLGQRAEAGGAWSVMFETLKGGRRAGVDLLRVDNGRLAFDVVPTRGFGLWAARLSGDRVGWRSPVVDGPVHPALVDLTARGGLGWLRGFDELLARCGLESNGPPVFDEAGHLVQTLHGRIATIPAHHVAVHVDDAAPHAITVEGRVDEAELFFAQLRLTSRITTEPGSNRLTVRDEITNRHDAPAGFQLLYHWNFGPPQLEEGARFVAPIAEMCPRDARAAEGIGHFDVYAAPTPGFAEQVYLFRLAPGDDGRTVALLRNRAGDKGVALRFDVRQLPCFTLWKSTQGEREGYVTGLEPAVNYPNPRPVEEARGRVVMLPPGGSYVAETVLEVLDTAEAVAAVEAEARAIQGRAGAPRIHGEPVAPFV